ncbi:phosphate ABC transporter permease [Phormidium sp. CLA17]|uniref:phosphate ABC transporter permease n=1 Tax=Leptolyngbya sp. Cla-17 TaxID=2803751 RepID=UPI001492E046|nr:phosphate ABC transporter permease [Leptolyngbya sp. Cla-17]MBM0741199.1 phosphate ABC transporter permease [Leptolyngbya sp. Cla-17]
MLVPLTRKTFESLIPMIATGGQYAHFWGKLRDVLRRVLISVVGIFAIVLIRVLILQESNGILLFVGLTIGLYWIWGPILWASLRNLEYRRYGYAGFWQGRVTDIFLTEELIGTEENVNNRGELVIVENRERCLNLEVGDETGFTAQLRVPLKRYHRAIDLGDVAEMLVLSNRGDLGRIAQTTDIYIPDHNLWVSDYPYLQHDAFIDVSRRLSTQYPETVEAVDPVEAQPTRRKRTPKGTGSKGGAMTRSQPDEAPDTRRRGLEDTDSDYQPASSPRKRRSPRRPTRDD